jgi:hypothetical protein
MPKPNSNNYLAFKNYLRANKEKFTSGIQTCVLGDIQDVLLTVSAGIDTSQITRVIIFDDGERVGLSTVLNQKQLFYVPALPNDSIVIGVGTDGDLGIKSSRGYKLDFVGDGDGIRYENQIFGLNSVIGLGTDTSLTVLGLGGGLFLPGDPPSYSITESATTINEGQAVSFAVTTSNVGSGTTLYYNVVGNTSNADFLDGSLSGSFVITNGSGSFSKTLATDSLYNEFVEGFKVNISTGSTIGAIVGTSNTIFVTNLGEPSYTIDVSTTTVNEGQSLNFTINTLNVGNGTTLYYSTSGTVSSADFSNNSLTGAFNIVGVGQTTGIATVTRTIATDLLTEGNETFNLVVRTNSISGTIVATSPTITVVDIVSSYVIGASTETVSEGGSVTFTINTLNVGNGTTLYYSTSGTVSSADFSNNSLTGSFVVNNNTATITRTIANDSIIEGNETFNLVVRTNSISGTIVATSPTITVLDVVPQYSVTSSTNSINEGSSVVFTVTTVGIANGTVVYWTTLTTLGSVSASDFNDAGAGGFTVNNNTGTITRTLATDRFTEGPEQFKLEIRTSSTSGTIVATSDSVTINDTSKDVGSSANGLTFGPVQVNRDNGNTNLASDWYTICGLENIPDESSIALFIDNSGSMTTATVQASYNLLVSKLNVRGITITIVTNSNEDWITPFLVDLS